MGSILDESEIKGNGGLKSLTSLSRGELVTIQFINDDFFKSDLPRKFNIKIYSNKTIFELIREVALVVKTTWDEIKLLTIKNVEIKQKDNGKSISEMKIKSGATLSVNKRKVAPIKEAELIINGIINPLAVNAFKYIFS